MAERNARTGNAGLLEAPTGTQAEGVAPDTTDAQNGTGEGQSAQGEGTAAVQEAVRKAKRDPNDIGDDEVISINVRIPNKLRKLLATTAHEQTPETSVPQLVASMLAEAYSFELPKPKQAARVKKYANKEERLAAQKAAQQRQRNITRGLLKLVEEGKLDVDIEALLAQVESEQNATETVGATS